MNVTNVGRGFRCSQSFTRPSDTTAYSANDAISNSTSAPMVLSQALSAREADYGRYIVITNVRVVSSVKGSGLYCNVHIAPATFTATNDNSELSIDDATAATGIVISCVNNYTTALNTRVTSDPGWWEMKLGSTSATIYWCLQAVGAYTPASGEVFTVIIEGFFL